MTNFSRLLSPTSIGSMELRNRIVQAPMGVEMVEGDGLANEAIIAYYEERARGGVGLVITETCAMDYPNGANSRHQLGLSDDAFIPGMQELTSRVHAQGAKIAVQLAHHGKVSRVDKKEGRDILVPSIPEWHGSFTMIGDSTAEELGWMAAVNGDGGGQLKEMTTDDILETVDKFAEAGRRARDAGFDGVEIHASHGYLISAFLSKAWNTRTDEYGGSIEQRSRFLVEIITAMRQRVNDEIPIWCRLDAVEYLTPQGIEFADARITARLAQQAGAAAIHLSAYGDGTSASAFTLGTLPHTEAKHKLLSARLKADLDIPIIGVGRVKPEVGEQMLADGHADLIAMGRQLLADPAIANKLAAGAPENIRPCINCYVCVASPFFDRRVHCAVNPALGNENEFGDADRTTAADPKRVVVVGGGPAGMEAARVAASRGHTVTLFESSPQLGGALRFAALVYEPNRPLLAWLTNQMEVLGVDVRTGTAANAENIRALSPDHVIVAIGGARERSAVPGANLKHVVDGDDLRKILTGAGDGDASKVPLAGRLAATAGRVLGLTADAERLAKLTEFYMPVGKEVAIVGGGLVGIEIAEFLVDRGRQVTVIDQGPTMAPEMAHPRRWRVLTDLRDHGATLINGATVTRIDDDSVHYTTDVDGVPTAATVAAQSVIIATGLVANPHLDAWETIAGTDTTVVGDASGITYIEGAIYDGFNAALALG